MSTLNLIEKLEQLGVILRLDNDRLKIHAKKGQLAPDLLEEIKGQKDTIIKILKRGVEQVPFSAVEAVEERDYYPLSSAQKRLYFLQQMDIEGTGYNMPLILPLGKDSKKDKLESILKRLIVRHESLRTSFEIVDEHPVQRVHRDVSFELEYYEGENSLESFIQPFDLGRAPLMRSVLIRRPGKNHVWLVDIHHIVSDGTSQTVLIEDFITLYKGEELEPRELPIQYKDFALWQNRLYDSGDIKPQWDYWLDMYADSGEIEHLQLPTDRKRPEIYTSVGDHCLFKLDRKDTAQLRELASRCGGTLYMNLLAAINTLFYIYTGQMDIIIGNGIAGRHREDLQRIMGMFINILAMRNHPEGEKTYESFFKDVIAHSIRAFENQDVQFEELVDRLNIQRDASRNPLFDIAMVALNFRQPAEETLISLADDQVPPLDYKNDISKFDISFIIDEQREDIHITIEYYRGIFDKETVRRMGVHLMNVIAAINRDPSQKLKDIEIISDEEKQQVLYEFNNTEMEFPKDKTIHQLFDEQVKNRPQQIAVRSHLDLSSIYDELSTERLNPASKEELEKCCFKKNPYIFQFESNRFLQSLDMFEKHETDRLVLLRTHRSNFVAVNRETLSLLDYLDGKTNLKSLVKPLVNTDLEYWVFPIVIDLPAGELSKKRKIFAINGNDPLSQTILLFKELYRSNLIELEGYHSKIEPVTIDLDKEKIAELKQVNKQASTAKMETTGDKTVSSGIADSPQDAGKVKALLFGDRSATASTGILYIASYLRRHGIEAYCLWNNLSKNVASLKENVNGLLAKIQPNVVGVSLKWFPHIARVLEICKTVKSYDSAIQVVVGGDTASYYKNDIIKYDYIDFVVQGDGEVPFLKICQGETDIPNVLYKKDGKVVTAPISYVQSKDNNSDIYFSHMDKIFVSDLDPFLTPSFYINTGRGCSLNCLYCGGSRVAAKINFNRPRPFLRTVEEVRKDIIAAKDYTSRFMYDFDLPAFNLVKYFSEVWDGIDLSNHFCRFYFWMVPSEEFIQLVVKTYKYVYINMDVCSLSEPHRMKLTKERLVKPQPRDDRLFGFFENCSKYDNVDIILNHITGLPYFSYEDIEISKKNLNYLMEKHPDFVDMDWGRLHAQPGAAIVKEPEKYGMHSFAKTYEDFLYYSELNLKEDHYPEIFNFNYPYIYSNDEQLNSKVSKFYSESAKRMEDHRNKRRKQLNVTLQLTYEELNRKSGKLAVVLMEKGVKPGTIVGLYMEKSLEMIVGLLAVLKAGAAYLPIDLKYPPERINYMLKDSKVKILLTRGDLHFQTDALEFEGECIDIYDEQLYTGDSRPLKNPAAADSLAYVIYTSGSTGKPKGVLVEHRNVVRLASQSNFIEFQKDDQLFLTGSFGFDITTFETWAPLLNGVGLFLGDQNLVLDAGKLKDIMQKNNITILHLIPQLFNQLAAQRPEIFKDLRCLLVGGDLVKPSFVNKIRNTYKDLKILHMYGPTENTTFSTFFPVDRDYETTIPIGKPIANSYVCILSKGNRLQPVGVSGELCTGGHGVARGYLNNPELTAERFVISDLTNDQCPMTNDRFYRTGDLARWLPDGNLQFLGRIDQQVKIRGYRIEPAEIESRLLNHESIKEAVVTDGQDQSGEKFLCAYIVFQGGAAVESKELNAYLSQTLPDYMVPTYFMPIEKIPLTDNGKVARSALPLPGPGAMNTGAAYKAPRDETETKIVQIWSEILYLPAENIGIDDNFFDLGGHSLRATVLISKIDKELNVKVPLAELFKTPTIKEIASLIKVIQWTDSEEVVKKKAAVDQTEREKMRI
jgi:amino acid adenylation domain-containing protein